MKKFLSLLLAGIMAATMLVGCANTAEKNTFIVGVDDGFAPMGFRDEANEIVGFDIDLAKEAGKRMGKEVIIQPIEWSQKVLELNNDKIDVIWNGFTITEERQKEVLFTRPYLKNNQIIVVAADSDIATKADLAGREVGLQSGSSAMDALSADPINEQIKACSEYENNVYALNDLKIGRVEAVIVDEVVGKFYVSKEPESFKVLDESLAAEEYGIGVKMGNEELLNELQKAIDEMIADGTAAEISTKWFGEDIVLK